MSIFQVIGLGLKLAGASQAARAEEQRSIDTADNMIIDRIRGEAAAAQAQTARYRQYFDDVAANEAALLKNRNFDSSVAAFMEAQKKVAFDDLTIMASQANMEKSKQTLQSLLEIQRGQNRATAIRINGAASFMSGLHDLQDTLFPTE